MKKIFLLLTLVCSFCIGCGNDDEGKITGISEYEIPRHCKADVEDGKVIIINNKKDFKKAFADSYDSKQLKDINFNNANLLVVSGVSPNQISKMSKQFLSVDDEYKLEITIQETGLTALEPWTVGYLVPKEIKSSDVELIINDIPFHF